MDWYRAVLGRSESASRSVRYVCVTSSDRTASYPWHLASRSLQPGHLDRRVHLPIETRPTRNPSNLLYDYRTNVASYPAWQAWLRERKPPTLVVWGRNDPSFIAPGAEAYRRDLPDAEIHLLEAGHFALDEKNDEIAGLIIEFLSKHHV